MQVLLPNHNRCISDCWYASSKFLLRLYVDAFGKVLALALLLQECLTSACLVRYRYVSVLHSMLRMTSTFFESTTEEFSVR